MAISLRQNTTHYRGALNGSTHAFGANIAAGSLIVVLVTHNTNNGVGATDTLGNTYSTAWTVNNAFGNVRSTCLYAWNSAAGANTVTITASVSTGDAICCEFTGARTSSDPLDVTSTGTGTGAPADPGSITPTGDGRLVVAASVVASAGSAIVDPSSGFTSLWAQTSTVISAADYLIQSAAAAVHPTWSFTTSARWAAGVGSFAAGPPPDPGPRPSTPPQQQGPRAFRPTRTGDYTVPLLWPTPTQNQSIRVDVYAAGASPARLADGPITQVLDFEYGNAVDRIGDAKLVLPATDPKVAYITDLAQLRIYRGGEGRVFVGRVREITTGQDAAGMATTEITLDDLAVDLAVAKTGLGLTLTDVSPAGMLSALLAAANTTAPTSFASGSVDSSSVTLRKRHDADDVWPAIVANAPVWSMHARHDSITTPTAPVVDLGAFGADSGLQFGIGDYPLQEIRKQRSGGTLVNRIIGFGQGEGYPALSLKAASHGANILADPNFESGVADWTPTSATMTRVAGGVWGRWAGKLAATSASQASAQKNYALSGTTTGRKFKAGIRVQGAGTTLGHFALINVYSTGGVGTDIATSSLVTLTAAHQYVEAEVTLGAGRTAVSVQLTLVAFGGQVAGDYVVWSRGTFWESTNFRYCVEGDPDPSAAPRYWIEDVASSTAYGVREDYRTVKVAYPISATKASWIGACDQVYDLCAEWLQLHTAALSTYSAKVLGLNHVSGGSQVVKVGDKSKLWFHGATADGAWLTVDALLWLMAYRRRVGAAGTNEWELTLSSVDLHYMDAFARLAAQMQEYRGSGTELKQSNYTFAVTAEGYLGSGAPTGTPSSVYMAPAMRDILAIVKVTYVVIQLSGAAKTVDVTIQGSGVPGSSLNLATNVNVTSAVSYDVTQYFQQSPTPVPWADGSVGWGDINVLVALNSAGVGPWRYRTTLFFETTKIPLPPN